MAYKSASVVEVGTSWTTALTGEKRDDGGIFVTGIGQTPSSGVRKGVVIDIDRASACVRSAIEKAEQKNAKPISEVFLMVSGAEVQGSFSHASVAVEELGGRITHKDVEKVKAVARSMDLPKGHEIIHSIPKKYVVDGHDGIQDPLGMVGSSLSVDMLLVHAHENLVNHTAQAVTDVGLDIADVVFSGLSAALATLTTEQKHCGVLLVDLGGGVTTYIAYSGGTIAAAGGMAVGGDHVTNDIMLAFNLAPQSAADLKHQHGAATLDPAAHFQRVFVPEELGFAGGTFALSDLNSVIHARMDELFRLLHARLVGSCDLASLGAGIVLTGGGAMLQRVDRLASEVFGLPCIIGRPRDFFGLTALSSGPANAAPLGMLRYVLQYARQPSRTGMMGKLWKRLIGEG